MKCDCLGWEDAVENNGPFKKLSALIFYCPWCGKFLGDNIPGKIVILKSSGFGKRAYDFKIIESLLIMNPHLDESWRDDCGISKDDDRAIEGWPWEFEKFYSGYHAGRYRR